MIETPRSADGKMRVVTLTGALLEGTGSGVSEVIETVLVTIPNAFGVTMMVMVAVVFAGSSEMVPVTS